MPLCLPRFQVRAAAAMPADSIEVRATSIRCPIGETGNGPASPLHFRKRGFHGLFKRVGSRNQAA